MHLPNSTFTGGTPNPAELGQFTSANMVAANLVVPEPSSVPLLLASLVGLASMGRFRRQRA